MEDIAEIFKEIDAKISISGQSTEGLKSTELTTEIYSKLGNKTMGLKDGNTYNFDDINRALLVSLGYTDAAERGRILERVC